MVFCRQKKLTPAKLILLRLSVLQLRDAKSIEAPTLGVSKESRPRGCCSSLALQVLDLPSSDMKYLQLLHRERKGAKNSKQEQKATAV